jgi:hypothetical protein
MEKKCGKLQMTTDGRTDNAIIFRRDIIMKRFENHHKEDLNGAVSDFSKF